MKQKIQSESRAGFTLMELLISIFIIGMVAGVSIINFRVGDRQKRVQLAADGVINAIRNAQNFTLTSRQLSASSCMVSGVPEKSAAYFIIMFGASNTQTLYGVDKCDNLLTIETYSYPSNIQVKANGYLLNAGVVSALQFRFQAPFGVITASSNLTPNTGPFASFASGSITIESSDSSTNRTITVDGVSGKVE